MDRRGSTQNEVATETNRAGATRVRFRERQILRAADLAAEQSYLIVAHRRHHIGQHGWGIVSGLELASTPEGPVVQPGVAIDGYGRELIVPSPIAIPDDALGSHVWLVYQLNPVSVPQRGSWDCGPGQNTRARAQPSLYLTSAGEGGSLLQDDPRAPVEVPFDDLPFFPHRTPPDDPAREWPVYLGTVRRSHTPINPNAPRPYATLVGEVVNSPSGRARMQVGSELRTDTRRFAVSVADPAGKLTERLAIDRDGNTVVTANTTISDRTDGEWASDLTMLANAPDPNQPRPSEEPLCGPTPGSGNGETPGAARMVRFNPLAATPEAAMPWQIYRTSIVEGKRTIKQLRIELGHPGDKGDPKLSKLTIGTGTGENFVPHLTVTADGEVTIQGRLQVSGQLIQGPISVDPTDPRFTDEIANQWARGTLIAEEKLGTLFTGVNSGELTVLVAGANQLDLNGQVINTDETLPYAFLVTNNGSARITNIQLYVSVTFAGESRMETLPAAQFALDPGEERLVTGSSPVDPDGVEGVINISVSVLGVGPLPNVIAAAGSASIRVEEQIGPG